MLTKDSVDADPIKQFDSWLQEAIQAQLPEPTAMVLATVLVAEIDSRFSCKYTGTIFGHGVFNSSYFNAFKVDWLIDIIVLRV